MDTFIFLSSISAIFFVKFKLKEEKKTIDQIKSTTPTYLHTISDYIRQRPIRTRFQSHFNSYEEIVAYCRCIATQHLKDGIHEK